MYFCDVFEDVTKWGRKLQTSEYKVNGKYPIYDQGQDLIAGYTDEESGLFTDVPVILFGDHTRIAKYIDTPCFLGADGVKLLKSKLPNINPRYLYYAVSAVVIPNTGYNRHFKWLKEARIKICERLEQDRIVERLNSIESLIDIRKQQLQKLDELIKARFVEMFGDLRSNPKGWPVYRFEEITDIITDGEHATPRRTDHGIYLLSARNVLDHALRLDDVDYIDQDEYERIAKRIIPQAGDVLISCSGTVGRCCSVPEGLKFQMVRSTALLRFKKVILPVYAEYMITSDDLQEQINSSKTASSQANLFQGKIAQLRGFVPPLDSQKEFAIFVSQVDKSKLSIQASLDKLETLRQSLIQKYFG